MHSRRTAFLATLVLALAACSAATPGTTLAPTNPPTPALTSSAARTPEPATPAAPLPTTEGAAAWWYEAGVSACGIPVRYRIDGGQIVDLGSCAAFLGEPAASAEMRVGQDLDMHITTDTTGPIYPLPQSTDDSILRLVSQADNGATGSYQAVGSGTVVLMTNGLCMDTRDGVQTDGPCPVLTVTVTP